MDMDDEMPADDFDIAEASDPFVLSWLIPLT